LLLRGLGLALPFALGVKGSGGIFSKRRRTSSSLGVFAMAERPSGSVEAKVIHKLPASLLNEIGRVVVAYSRLEHKMTATIAMTLQLQKVEARMALDEPLLHDRLDTIQDLFALKGLLPEFPFDDFWKELKVLNALRNSIAHGIWLRHPQTKKIWLRLVRGHWKKTEAF
jgi:hypothetical protein